MSTFIIFKMHEFKLKNLQNFFWRAEKIFEKFSILVLNSPWLVCTRGWEPTDLILVELRDQGLYNKYINILIR